LKKPLQIQRWFLPLLELDIHPKLVQYINWQKPKPGLGSEYVRATRLTLTGEERETNTFSDQKSYVSQA